MRCHRHVLVCTLVVMMCLGPLPSALAQAPAPAPTVVEVMPPPERPETHRADVYDVGATVVTVARAPFSAALCGLAGVTSTVLFVLTFGTAYKATARVLEEGCAQRWVIRGDDLRPRGGPGVFPDRSADVYSHPR
jgi:hypothetical protein